MREVTIKIKTSGSAFEDYANEEVARILQEVTDYFKNGNTRSKGLMDINGNRVGEVTVK